MRARLLLGLAAGWWHLGLLLLGLPHNNNLFNTFMHWNLNISRAREAYKYEKPIKSKETIRQSARHVNLPLRI